METLLPPLDSVERFLYPTHLPILGPSAIDSILSSSRMDRMSPDSTMESSGWPQSPADPTGPDLPDSTTPAYDSDAFCSDDSNQSLPEILNPTIGYDSSFSSPSPADSDSLNNNDEAITVKKKKKSKRAGDVVLQCEMCSYTTRFKEHLTSHMNTHYADRNFMCSDCGQTFKWSHSLKRHQRSHKADFKFKCRFCGKGFLRKDHLTIHENLHTQQTDSFPCSECGASFKNKKTLTGHMKTHSAEKQFKCEKCDSEFTRRASLNRHVKAAHAGHVFPCPLCQATFSYRSTLEDHKKAAHNEGKREFGCQLCGVQFAVKAYLTKHLVTCRNRADGRSFACSQCTKTFPTKRHLNEHGKRKHKPMNATTPLPPMNFSYQQYPYYPPASDLSYSTSNGLDSLDLPPVDLPLPQISEPVEENVGSLLRLVYSNQDHQHSLDQHSLMGEYSLIEELPLDCL